MKRFQIVLRHIADAGSHFPPEAIIDVIDDDEAACQMVTDWNRALGSHAPCEYFVRTIDH